MSSNGPSSGEPEYLSSDDPAAPREPKPRSSKKPALLVGGVVVLAGLVGGGLWLWSAYSSTGDQPSQALPADTLGYMAVDLDPSGKQKIEAIRTLRKFPAFRDAVDVEDEDDLRRRIIEEALADSDCDINYADDVEPWLGQRFGLAAVPGDEEPAPVVVLQVTDADAADEGLTTLQACGDEEDSGAWEIRGDWAVVAETEEIVKGIADAAAESSLADDGDFQKWTGAAGDEGILTAYAAPSAGEVLGKLASEGGMSSSDAFGSEELAPDVVPDAPVPPQLEGALKEFEGAAMTMRFADGAIELEAATAATSSLDYASQQGGGVVATLPEDTAVAIGLAFTEGWGEAALDAVREQMGPDADETIGFFEAQLGLELPADLETVVGESMAFSLGADFDVATLGESPAGSGIPVGAKIQGDAEGIEGVLDKLQAAAGPGGGILGTDTEDDLVAVGPNEDYRQELLGDGGLGDSAAYQNVVREGDKATAVMFVNFDADDWLASLVRDQGDAETAENIVPLEAAGISAWQEDDGNHVLMRVTTEE